ncbi:SDR family oxidoreductase [Asaia krungthepensis]|uniref:NADH-ubiquinone oxidoreductase 39-40 kDa subunit n=1 Tax=Asaia krungthepensis NRIC 0535 TaxID=1307925 RepID=A0ABQ0Q180_9PROT|nr:NAD(P)H-binding protein [Asaia krungthepensis]GBQ86658.1 NADH-ubiquinone oxidoreductase 39-40 kDa subunit [Asaia krungthepensis NRIC 0535]
MASPVHLIGANGRSGQAIARALMAEGETVIPVIRAPEKLPDDLRTSARVADLEDACALATALADATRIVSTAHARSIPAILDAAPQTACLIALGSTRKFTRWPDAHGNGVLAGEAALLASGRKGMILHPTMIYGAQGEDNVQRLAALLKRLPVIPLPNGGRSLVQPIYQDDVTRAVIAALSLAASGQIIGPESLVIAGPQAVSYRGFIEAILAAAGLGKRVFLPVPGGILEFLAPLAARLPGLPSIGRAEIRRLLEDKAFPVAPMTTRLGFAPIPLQDGLARLFASSCDAAPLAHGSRP